MRYIDPKKVEACLTADWQTSAADALSKLENRPINMRAAFLETKQNIWKELKSQLADISSQKCWFCESGNVRSDNAVDHFRPKNEVAEDPAHEGYWWLAFDWKNFRFTCTFCNSLRNDPETGITSGKGTHFPILDELYRARTLTDDCEKEQPLLLDPCCRTDPPHLWFEENGQAGPNPSVCTKPASFPAKRVDASIKHFHLNHSVIVDSRKVFCQKAKQDAMEAERMMPRYDNGDMTARTSIENTIRSLQDMLSPGKEYSRAVRCTLMALRGTSRVAEMALEAA